MLETWLRRATRLQQASSIKRKEISNEKKTTSALRTHDLRNELAEELIPSLMGERCTNVEAKRVRERRNGHSSSRARNRVTILEKPIDLSHFLSAFRQRSDEPDCSLFQVCASRMRLNHFAATAVKMRTKSLPSCLQLFSLTASSDLISSRCVDCTQIPFPVEIRILLPGARPSLHKPFQVFHQRISRDKLLSLSLAKGFGEKKRSMERKETVFINVTIPRLRTFHHRVAQKRP